MDLFNRTKLRGQIALIDHEITNKKKAFGVKLYNLIIKQRKQNQKQESQRVSDAKTRESSGSFLETLGSGIMEAGNNILETPGVLNGIEFQIKEPLNETAADVKALIMEKRTVQKKIENAPLGLGNWWMCQWAKIRAIDRDIMARKEQFGLDVWSLICENEWLPEAMATDTVNAASGMDAITGAVGCLVKGLSGSLNKTLETTRSLVSDDEKEVVECVDQAKEEVKKLEMDKREKERSLAAIGKQAA